MISNIPPGYTGAPSPYPADRPGDYPAGMWPGEKPPRPGRRKGVAIAAAAAVAVLAGAGGAYAYDKIQNSDPAGCSVKGAKTVVLDKKSDAEPSISVPVTAGWKRYARDDISSNAMVLDAPTIRGFIANPGAQANGFAPNIVVVLDEYTGPPVSPEAINESDTEQMRAISQVVEQSTSTVCGTTVFRKDVVGIGTARDGGTQDGSVFLTVVKGEDGKTWVASATIQTRDDDNESFLAQRDAMAEGFHATAAGT